MYWEKEIETLPVPTLRQRQRERLQDAVRKALQAPYYRKLYQHGGVTPESIRDIDDIRKLPFTTKADLRAGYPYAFLTVDKTDVIRMHSSSGTTGQATVVFHTAGDIRCWANLIARCMYMVGTRSSDVFQNMTGYGMFTGGLGFHYGAELLGAMTLPAGSGGSKRQIRFMKDFSTTVLHVIPSYALHLLSVFEELDIDPRRDLNLKIAFLGAEPHTENTRRRVEAAFGVKAYNSYGLSEMYGPGVAFECPQQQGMHIWEDAFLAEVVHPETLEPVGEGQEGELVLTSLTREAMPLIRYRTRDLTAIVPGPCPCGRTHRRIDRIKGRTDDMFIVKGVNVFPMQIEAVLMGIAEVGTNYRILLDSEGDIDVMTVEVEVGGEFFRGDVKGLNDLRKRLTDALRGELLFTPRVALVEPGVIPESAGKAVRVTDRRNRN